MIANISLFNISRKNEVIEFFRNFFDWLSLIILTHTLVRIVNLQTENQVQNSGGENGSDAGDYTSHETTLREITDSLYSANDDPRVTSFKNEHSMEEEVSLTIS